jgi:hypothetical protein
LYPTLRDWIEATARLAVQNMAVNWLFRIHPAEAFRGTSENTEEILRAIIPDQLPHIRIIESKRDFSSYQLIDRLHAGITVRGTLCVEFPCYGVPMICAGTGQTSVANFNYFPSTIQDYEQRLLSIQDLGRLNEAEINEAQLYAYALFAEKRISLSSIEDLSSLEEMRLLRESVVIHDEGLSRCKHFIVPQNESKLNGSIINSL